MRPVEDLQIQGQGCCPDLEHGTQQMHVCGKGWATTVLTPTSAHPIDSDTSGSGPADSLAVQIHARGQGEFDTHGTE